MNLEGLKTVASMDKLVHRIDELVREGEALRTDWRNIIPGDTEAEERGRRTARWVENVAQVLRFAGLEALLRTFQETQTDRARPPYQFAQLVGVVQAARDTIAGGYLGRLEHLVHASVFGSLLDQARSLLDAGHVIPAAVLGRIVLEGWLRDEAERAGIPIAEDEKASGVNDKLKQGGSFAVPRWRLVQGYLDVGNAAAHGNTAAFKTADVEQMLAFAANNAV